MDEKITGKGAYLALFVTHWVKEVTTNDPRKDEQALFSKIIPMALV